MELNGFDVKELLLTFWPLLLLQLVVQLWALVDLIRRRAVKWMPKLVWAIIILANLLGAIFYLAAGREE